VTLADQLEVTAAALAGGCSIDRINRARRTEAPAMPDPTISSILDRLTAAHGVARRFDFTIDERAHEDGQDVLKAVSDLGARPATELVEMLAGLESLLSDVGSAIARLTAENAGVKARSGK
jgi:hypothetical protein